jgi:VWFA-related protein
MRCLALFLASAFFAAAQSDEIRASSHVYTPPLVRLTVQSQLVQLEVVVRDPHGHAVSGLRQGDFEILDEGKPRAIAAFSVETLDPGRASAAAGSTTAPANSQPAATPLPQAAPPRSTLLFFDDLHAPVSDLQRVQIAAKRFIKDGMGPGARAAVFAASQGLILDFTADADALTAAVGKLHPHPRISENGIQSCPRMTPYQAYLIDSNSDYSAFNAALQEMQHCEYTDPNERRNTGVSPAGPTGTDPNSAAVRAQATATWEQARRDSLNSFAAIDTALALLARIPGTRVLLMVSTGFLSGMLEAELDATIDRAIHAGIVINALDAKGLWAEPPGRPFSEGHTDLGFPLQTFAFEIQTIGSRNAAMNAVMEEAASATGGLFFHNSNDLVGGFSTLTAVPETTYLLAFRPDTEGAAGKYRKLKVRLTALKGDYVQARPGYFSPGNAPGRTVQDSRPIDRQVPAQDVLTEIPIQVDGQAGKSENGDRQVSLKIHVDVSPLKFSLRDGRHVQKLTFIGALLDADGAIVAAKEGVVDFALQDETLPRLMASGLKASLSLAAPPGLYRVRVVVQDADGKMASLNRSMEIPK